MTESGQVLSSLEEINSRLGKYFSCVVIVIYSGQFLIILHNVIY
jgi:hypothetical protein